MSRQQQGRDGDPRDPGSADGASDGLGPGKRTITEQLPSTYLGPPVQGQLGPGKRTLVEQIDGPPTGAIPESRAATRRPPPVDPTVGTAVQRRATTSGPSPTSVHEAAAQGVATPSSPLPYANTIERAFGRHDVSSIQAHQGPDAAASAQALGAQAYATGNHVVLGASPDLHTVAHEAAHVVQQRGGVQLKGGVGEAGDAYERHADAVADAVVAGQSAVPLLDRAPGGGHHQAAVQRAPASPGPEASRQQPATPPRVMHYNDMLAAVLAAQSLSDHTKPDDPAAHAQILALLEPVERRLGELNDHQGRLAQFGAGNIAGQTALDTAEAAIRSWRQLLLLGAMVRTDELVLRFRMGAEVLQFLTGEQRDAPTLREFNHVSGLVGMGAAAAVLTPALVALAAAEAPLLAFVGRLAAQRVALWAAAHPAAALAASEVLLGFGLQIVDGGWESFWDQLHDPNGRWFVLAQVLMDYMHVRGSLGGHDTAPTASPRRPAPGGPEVDVEAARQQIAKARAALRQVHDAAASAEPTAAAHPVPVPAADHQPSTAEHSGPTKGAARVDTEVTTPELAPHPEAKAPFNAQETPTAEPPKVPHDGAVHSPATSKAARWLATLESSLTPEEKAKLAKMKGDKTPQQTHDMFTGDLDGARERVRTAVRADQERAAVAAQSKERVADLRKQIAERGLMNDPEISDIVAGKVAKNPNARVSMLRDKLMAKLLRAEAEQTHPGAKVLDGVKIYEKLPEANVNEWEAKNPGKKRDGLTDRADGLYLQRGEIDMMVIEPQQGGKARVVAREEVKTGIRDTNADARGQITDQSQLLSDGAAGKKVIRLEVGGQDITAGLDLASDASASKSTRGPTGKGFDKSLGVSASDLEAMCKAILAEAEAAKGGP